MRPFRILAFVPFCAALALAACDSPTGPRRAERLLITRIEQGNPDVYTILPDGSGPVRLTSQPYAEYCARWSPDGRRIAYVASPDSVRSDGYWSPVSAVYVMNADGSDPVRLSPLSPGTPTGCPDWHPDGSKLAYDRWSAEAGAFAVHVLQADGSGEVRLPNGENAWTPRWSPDGRTLAFAGSGFRARSLGTMGADGSSPQILHAACSGAVYHPQWSPDGTRIAYTCADPRVTSQGSSVYTVRADGTDVVHVDVDPAPGYEYDAFPVWSPDGRRLALARDVNLDDGHALVDLYVVELATGTPRRITSFPGVEYPTDWR